MSPWLVLAAALTCKVTGPDDVPTAHVRCRSGDAVASLDFPSYAGPSTVEVIPRGADVRWVVSIEPGGSDVHFWWWPIRVEPDALVRLLPEPVETTSQDAVCANGAEFLGVLMHLWEDHPGEWHYAPHRYEFTSYSVDARGSYVQGEARLTRHRHESWRGAAKELGVGCDDLGDEVKPRFGIAGARSTREASRSR